MKSLILVVTAVAFTSLYSCSTAYVPPKTYSFEKTRVMAIGYDVAWGRVVAWFTNHNAPIKNIDKSSGLITTERDLLAGDMGTLCDCGAKGKTFGYYDELSSPTGNFNVFVQKIDEDHTKVTVSAFYKCKYNLYTVTSLGLPGALASSTPTNCESTGSLEKELLNYIESSL